MPREGEGTEGELEEREGYEQMPDQSGDAKGA